MFVSPKFLRSVFIAGALLAAPSLTTAAEKLSIQTLFTGTGLEGAQVSSFKFSPDGRKVAYLKGSHENPRQYDIWLYDVASKSQQILVRAADLEKLSPSTPPTADERARHERLRLAASGILSFDWAPDNTQLFIPWSGKVIAYNFADQTFVPHEAQAPMVNPKLSPDGARLAYVSGNDLFVKDLGNGKTKRLTKSSHPQVRHGIAEFIAAEELRRDTGFWWSPTGEHLAVMEVDGRPVPTQARYELLADSVHVNTEPYPYAGDPNVKLRLAIINARSGRTSWVDLTTGLEQDADFYVTRVKWLFDGSGLFLSRQSRDQKKLEVLMFDTRGKYSGPLVTETSDTWISIHNDLIELTNSPSVLWGSSRDGFHRIYRYGKGGVVEGVLTPPDLRVDAIVGVNEATNRLYVEGYIDDPKERHLFALDLDPNTNDKPERLNLDAGVHQNIFSPDGSQLLIRHTSETMPYRVSLRSSAANSTTTIVDGSISSGHPYAPYYTQHVTPQFGTLRAEDGTELHYRLSLPRNIRAGQKVPVLVHVYGGPGVQSVTRAWGPLWHQAALAQGYAIFTLDNRGTARRGKAFENTLHNSLGEIEVKDQLAGLDWLKSRPEIDPKKIAVYGWSYGGYMALKMAQATSDISAVITGAPVTDWRLYDTHYTERFMGMPQNNGPAYDKSSVYPDLPKLKAPLLLLHGLADDNVLLSNSTKLISALQEQGTDFDLMVYPGMGHAPREHSQQRHLYETIFKFLDRKLK